MKFFGVKEFFIKNFDFRHGCKNELNDNNEKSCSWSRNRFSHRIDFKAVWPRNGHAASVGVNNANWLLLYSLYFVIQVFYIVSSEPIFWKDFLQYDDSKTFGFPTTGGASKTLVQKTNLHVTHRSKQRGCKLNIKIYVK